MLVRLGNACSLCNTQPHSSQAATCAAQQVRTALPLPPMLQTHASVSPRSRRCCTHGAPPASRHRPCCSATMSTSCAPNPTQPCQRWAERVAVEVGPNLTATLHPSAGACCGAGSEASPRLVQMPGHSCAGACPTCALRTQALLFNSQPCSQAHPHPTPTPLVAADGGGTEHHQGGQHAQQLWTGDSTGHLPRRPHAQLSMHRRSAESDRHA